MNIWVEKYRPQNLDEVILPQSIKAKFEQYIKEGDYPHLLLVGKQGTGKTTVAKILTKTVNTITLTMNASDERGIETIRKKVKEFVQSSTFGVKFKTVFLDEADALTPDAQFVLRNLMETYAAVARFILTANYENKIIEPLRSRLQVFRFPRVAREQAIQLCTKILQQESVAYTQQELERAYTLADGDLRKMINILQQSVTSGGKIQLSIDDEVREFLTVLASRDVEKLKAFAFSKDRDFVMFYRLLFEKSTNPHVLAIVAEYMYRHSLVVDPAINFVACVVELWKNTNKK